MTRYTKRMWKNIYSSFFLACSCILNPPLDPQSGCRRQCLGVGAKTVETLGLDVGLFNSFLDSDVSKNFYEGEGVGGKGDSVVSKNL